MIQQANVWRIFKVRKSSSLITNNEETRQILAFGVLSLRLTCKYLKGSFQLKAYERIRFARSLRVCNSTHRPLISDIRHLVASAASVGWFWWWRSSRRQRVVHAPSLFCRVVVLIAWVKHDRNTQETEKNPILIGHAQTDDGWKWYTH